MRKLSPSLQHIVLPFLVSMMMSAIVSGISTVRALGIDGISHVWLGSWLTSWLVAFPALLVVMPIARKLTRLVVDEH